MEDEKLVGEKMWKELNLMTNARRKMNFKMKENVNPKISESN
jgi:hypothetical protein